MKYRFLRIVVPKTRDVYFAIERRKHRWNAWMPLHKTETEIQLFTLDEAMAILKTVED